MHAQAPEEGVGGGVERALAGFRVAHVLDVFRTEGEPLPEVARVPLEGTAPAALFDALANLLERSGYHLLRSDCSTAKGKTQFLSRAVVVRPHLSDAQALKTLVDEVADTTRRLPRLCGRWTAHRCLLLPLRRPLGPDGNLNTFRKSATRGVSCARRLVIGTEAELGIVSLANNQVSGEESPSS